MEQVLYKLSDGWEWRTFNDVCSNITDGAHASPKTVEEGFPYVTVRDVNNKGQIDIINCKRISEDDFLSLKKGNCLPPVDSVLLSKDGTVGKVAHVTDNYEEFVVLSSLAIIVPEKKYLSPEYLKYFLLSPEFQDHAISSKTGAAIKRIVLRTIKNFNIPIAPLEQQKRIVEKLDALLTRIDTAIEHLQESVTLADALFESSQSEIFNDVLSNYQHSTIDEICIVTSSKRIFKADYVESGIPFYRTKEIVDLSKEKNISTELFIDKEKFSEICGKFGAPKKGDLLFSAVGTIGVMWIVDEREFYFKDGNLLWLKDMNGVTPEYLKSAISAVLTEKIKDRSQGAAYKAISITSLKAFEIPLPSIEEQKSIVAKIEHVSSVTKKTKQELSLQINDLHNLKASILDSAFKGEL